MTSFPRHDDLPIPQPRMRQRKPDKRKRVEEEPEPQPLSRSVFEAFNEVILFVSS